MRLQRLGVEVGAAADLTSRPIEASPIRSDEISRMTVDHDIRVGCVTTVGNDKLKAVVRAYRIRRGSVDRLENSKPYQHRLAEYYLRREAPDLALSAGGIR